MSEEADIEFDRIFDAMGNPLRREIVGVIHAQGSMTTEQLGEILANPDEPSDDIRTTLHHNHLPKLEEAGIVSTHGDVSSSGNFNLALDMITFDQDRLTGRPSA